MATIYRFIVENKVKESGGRKSSGDSGYSKKTTAKKGKWVSLFGGEKGGVEHNRKMRAINPLMNKMTGGYWERGMRLGRAAGGLVKVNTETGKFGVSGPAIAIIIAMVIQMLLKYWNQQRMLADQANKQNFTMLENGFGQINAAYDVSTNIWNGRLTYNQNK